MSYFWIIPVAIGLLCAVWGFYLGIKRRAGHRTDGTILTDDSRTERRI
jgi:hypothetical protein